MASRVISSWASRGVCATTRWIPSRGESIAAQVRRTARELSTSAKPEKRKGFSLLVRSGLPFVLFSILSAWVVSNALSGKMKEMETSQGKDSKSLRQAAMEIEHEEMIERLNKIVAQDFDNTKRIKRPEEILEERRKARERRNAWHRRAYRWIFRVKDDDV